MEAILRLETVYHGRSAELRDALTPTEEAAAAIARYLQGIVPVDFVVHSERSEVLITSRLTWWGMSRDLAKILEQSGDLKELLATACWITLSAAQDYVSEAIHDAWPRAAATPQVFIEDDELLLGFGSDRTAAFRTRLRSLSGDFSSR